jgi:hypothetical protein
VDGNAATAALNFAQKSAPLIKSARATAGSDTDADADGGEVNQVRTSVTLPIVDPVMATTAIGIVVDVKPVVLEAGAQFDDVLR